MSGDLVGRLREYAKDWRDRAASNDIVEEAAARIAALEAKIARNMSDHGRMLWPDDREGICPTPDLCGEYETVRCSPCAIKQAEAAGVEVLQPDHSYSPEVCRLNRVVAALEAEVEVISKDKARLDYLQDESHDLCCFSIPTGGGDADIGWRVVGHWQAEPQERVVAEIWHDDPRAAIDAARAAMTADPQGSTFAALEPKP
jgi:hypothetical protein